MTNADYTIFVKRVEAVAVQLAEAERQFAARVRRGMSEDAADAESGLSVAADALMDLANAAYESGSVLAAVTATICVSEAGLPLRDDVADLVCAMAT